LKIQAIDDLNFIEVHKMFKLAIAASTALILTSSAAFAADLSVYQSSPIAYSAPSFSWTGGYVGLNAGYGWGQTDISAGGTNNNNAINGVVGGIQAGYNYDMGGFVLGAEADFNLTNVHHSEAGSTVRVNNFGTVRARAGLVADRFMPYVTAGVAYGRGYIEVAGTGKEEQTHWGWAAGLGAEYAVADNITVRAEYIHTGLAGSNYTLGGSPSDVRFNFGTVRAGVNFKF
jgi:outer membrane immunogenic protein